MVTTIQCMRVDLPASLRMLARSRSSGVLSIRAGDDTARIFLVAGRVLHATSDRTPRIGDRLVEGGHMTATDLENALRLQRRKKVKQPLGTMLHELGLVSRDAAEGEVEAQITRVLEDLFGWDHAGYEFEAVVLDEDHPLPPESNAVEAVLRRAGVEASS